MRRAAVEQGLQIDWMIHHDVLYEHYRNLGLEAFLEFPLTAWAKKSIERHFIRRLELVQACTHCGKCEEVCPQGLPIMDMLDKLQMTAEGGDFRAKVTVHMGTCGIAAGARAILKTQGVSEASVRCALVAIEHHVIDLAVGDGAREGLGEARHAVVAVPAARAAYRYLSYKIKPGGILFTFSCSQVISKENFRKSVQVLN